MRARETRKARQALGRGLPSRLLATTLTALTLGGLGATNAAAMLARSGPTGGSGPVLTQDRGIVRSFAWNGAPGSSSTTDTEIRLDADTCATIALWAAGSGTGLDRWLFVTVLRGRGRGAAFRPDPDGLVFRGTLDELPSSSSEGVVDQHTWSPGETNTYRVTVVLLGNARAQGRTAETTFSWTAFTR